jgi:hypothetical protein
VPPLPPVLEDDVVVPTATGLSSSEIPQAAREAAAAAGKRMRIMLRFTA